MYTRTIENIAVNDYINKDENVSKSRNPEFI